MRKAIVQIVSLFLGLLVTAFLVGCDFNNRPNGPTVQTSESPDKAEPYLFYLPNCEDGETVPCGTWDEQEYRVVFNYSPYSYAPMNECANEGGGKNLPCAYFSDTEIPAPFLIYSWDKDIATPTTY